MIWVKRFLIGLLGMLAGLTCATVSAEPLRLLVPAYFYPTAPGSDWDRLIAAATRRASIVTIVNPDTGPGVVQNRDYVRALKDFREAGGKVVGYVPSGYLGQQVNKTSSCQPAFGSHYSPSDIVDCAARYQQFYQLDGIFVDEMGPPAEGAPEAEVVAFYTQVAAGLRRLNPQWTIFGNPGYREPAALLQPGRAGADALVTFESPAERFAGELARTGTHGTASDSRFGALLIETAPDLNARAKLEEIRSSGFGYAYMTDRRRPNPYDRLPSYWDHLVDALQEMNKRQPQRR